MKIFQVDAFASRVFQGNPAAVVPLQSWPEDRLLQAIAAENNLAETAFFVPDGDGFHLRWFTPKFEVPLCGHATLASAYVIFNELYFDKPVIPFRTLSGDLYVSRDGEMLRLDFPQVAYQMCIDPPEALLRGLGKAPAEVLKVDSDPNYFAIYAEEEDITASQPDMALLESLHPYGVVISALGREHDCASRCFAPSYGIPEDPVTGSIHCVLAPYWGKRLGKTTLRAVQRSQRGGELFCEVVPERVNISGYATKYLHGEIFLPD